MEISKKVFLTSDLKHIILLNAGFSFLTNDLKMLSIQLGNRDRKI